MSICEMVLVKSSLPAAIVSSTSSLTAGIYSLRPSSTTVVTPPLDLLKDNLKKPTEKKMMGWHATPAPQRPSHSINSPRLNWMLGILWSQAAQKSQLKIWIFRQSTYFLFSLLTSLFEKVKICLPLDYKKCKPLLSFMYWMFKHRKTLNFELWMLNILAA